MALAFITMKFFPVLPVIFIAAYIFVAANIALILLSIAITGTRRNNTDLLC